MLFVANGFRAVTMEAVAEQAHVAKATLYSYFPDKEALFTAVAEEVASRVAAAIDRELSAEAPLDERLARALIARHRIAFELVDGTPHAHELMYTKEMVARAPVARVDAKMMAALQAALSEDPAFARVAAAMASTLFYGAIGVSRSAKRIEDVDAVIATFVRPYLAGVRTLAREGQRQKGRGATTPAAKRRGRKA